MRTYEVKKKRYILTPDEIRVLENAISILDDFTEDDDLCDIICSEAHTCISDAEDVLQAIIRLDEKDLEY